MRCGRREPRPRARACGRANPPTSIVGAKVEAAAADLEISDDLLFDLGSVSTITVRQGNGRRDRVMPVGEGAGAWLAKYVREARPDFVIEPDRGFIFLAGEGEPIVPKTLSLYVSRYVKASGVAKTGSCHLFRHVMATLMLENGADV